MKLTSKAIFEIPKLSEQGREDQLSETCEESSTDRNRVQILPPRIYEYIWRVSLVMSSLLPTNPFILISIYISFLFALKLKWPERLSSQSLPESTLILHASSLGIVAFTLHILFTFSISIPTGPLHTLKEHFLNDKCPGIPSDASEPLTFLYYQISLMLAHPLRIPILLSC